MEKRNYIAAMDPGSSSITIAVGALDDDGRLTIEGIVSRPMQGISRGEIDNRQLTSEAAKEAVAEVADTLGVHLSDVYLGTSGRHVRCAAHDYHVFVGEGSDGEILQEDVAALHHGMNNVQAEEGLRIMERIPGHYLIDGRERVKDPVGRFGKKLDATFNFVLGSSTLIDRLEKTLLAMGVRARKTFANAVASARAVLLPEEKDMGVAVIDLGAGTADLSVWSDGAVRFVRGIPFGVADINNDIKQQGILEKHVEGLKTNFGKAMARLVESDKLIAMPGRSPRDKQEISQKNLATIIEHRLREILGFVLSEIDDSGYAGKLKGGVVLTGGGSRITGLDQLVREMTGMEVRLALPDVHVADDSLAYAQDPANATVIGLLLKGLEESSPSRVYRNPTPRPEMTSRSDAGIRSETRAEPSQKQNAATDEPPQSADEAGSKKKDKNKNPDAPKGNPLSRWFNSFLSEPLDGDEDF